jgi:hypothetical protein
MSDLCEGARAAGWTQKKAEDWTRELFDLVDQGVDPSDEEFIAHWEKIPLLKRATMRKYLDEVLDHLEKYDE